MVAPTVNQRFKSREACISSTARLYIINAHALHIITRCVYCKGRRGRRPLRWGGFCVVRFVGTGFDSVCTLRILPQPHTRQLPPGRSHTQGVYHTHWVYHIRKDISYARHISFAAGVFLGRRGRLLRVVGDVDPYEKMNDYRRDDHCS